MKETPFAFAKLLFQYLQKSDIPSDKKKAIEDIISNTPPIQELCKELQNQNEINKQLSIITSFDTELAYKKINKINKKNRFQLFIRIVAAIVLIVTISITYWITSNDTYNSKLIGSGKTIFKTSDGNTVSLDTLSNIILLNNLALHNEEGILVISEKASHKENKNKSNIIDVPYKGMYTVKLPDGTKVRLNSGSTLEFSDDFYLNERTVFLNGEAFFDVVKSEGKPFIVKTQNVSIRVLGTKFNVKSYDNEQSAYTTLVEGEIELLENKQKITPGEQIVFDKTLNATTIKPVDIEPIIAWSDSMFHFDNTPLDEIMRRLSRWYDLKIKYLDDNPNIKHITYSGKIKMYSHPEDVLRKFEKTGNLKFELRKNTIFISKK